MKKQKNIVICVECKHFKYPGDQAAIISRLSMDASLAQCWHPDNVRSKKADYVLGFDGAVTPAMCSRKNPNGKCRRYESLPRAK